MPAPPLVWMHNLPPQFLLDPLWATGHSAAQEGLSKNQTVILSLPLPHLPRLSLFLLISQSAQGLQNVSYLHTLLASPWPRRSSPIGPLRCSDVQGPHQPQSLVQCVPSSQEGILYPRALIRDWSVPPKASALQIPLEGSLPLGSGLLSFSTHSQW